VKLAVVLDLIFEPIEQLAFKFGDLSATQARHVNMIALRPPFIKMLLALHVHKIEFVNQPVSLQYLQRAINRNPVDSGVELSRMAEDLRRIQVLFGIFYYAQNRPALMSQAKTTGRECRLQAARGLGLR